jgi:streptogramin lyase
VRHKTLQYATACAVLLVPLGAGMSQAQTADHAANLSNPYRTADRWPQLPDGRTWGSVTAVDVDPDGTSIWILDRCGANSCVDSTLAPILKFDALGRLVTSFGAGLFVFPHGMDVDPDGNVWVADGDGKDGKGHQVFKLSPDGKVLLTLGQAGVTGDGIDTFNRPSAVVVAAGGDVFVADGHGGTSNARIARFSKDGRFLMAWGRKGSGPGEIDGPHALAMDSRGRLFVGDRGNRRIQIFDQDGRFLADWKQFGPPSGLFIDRNDVLYVADSGAGPAGGIKIGSARDGTLSAFIPSPEPTADTNPSVESVAADTLGRVYGVSIGGRSVTRYLRK